MTTDFDKAFKVIVGQEGGYVNDPDDPGGETKYGISKRAYPNLDIKALDLEDAKHVYHADYWNKCRCSDIPWPLNLYLFDAAVNQGVDAARRMMQYALGVKQDGVLGPKTLAACQTATQWHRAKFLARRAIRYTNTRNFDRYGAGWLVRLFTVTEEGQK